MDEIAGTAETIQSDDPTFAQIDDAEWHLARRATYDLGIVADGQANRLHLHIILIRPEPRQGDIGLVCQSALKFDPSSASKIDPLLFVFGGRAGSP